MTRMFPRISAALAITAALSGCGSVVRFTMETPDRRYLATRTDATALRDCWPWSRDYGEWISCRDFWWFTPAFLIDLPLALVLDTVAYPFDAVSYPGNMESVAVWKEALATGTAKYSQEQYLSHFNTYTARLIAEDMSHGPEPRMTAALLDILRSVSTGDKTTKYNDHILWSVAGHPNISRRTFDAILPMARAKAKERDWVLLSCLARNPAMPSGYYREFETSSSYDVLKSFAKNEALPDDVLERLDERAATAIEEARKKSPADGWTMSEARYVRERVRSNREQRQSIREQGREGGRE